ncbi:MAG: hypothetical protein II956_11655 [Bacteroidales bacterium]|nr:hypothetical protein [Bacteroidales bacterium]
MKKVFLLLTLSLSICVCACDNDKNSDETVINNNSPEVQQKKSEKEDEVKKSSDTVIIVDREDGAVLSKYFIQKYIVPNNINLQQYETIDITTFQKANTPKILITFTGEQYALDGVEGLSNYAEKVGAADFVYEGMGALPVGYVSKDGNPEIIPVDKKELSLMVRENAKKFLQFAEQYGDTCFNRRVVPFSQLAVPDNIVEIDVICNEDYNAEHKQGSSLSDITDFYCNSFFGYIQSKYQQEPNNCLTDNINGENIQLFDPYCFLSFNQLPEKSGTYTFEVTIKLSGKTLKNTVTMNF